MKKLGIVKIVRSQTAKRTYEPFVYIKTPKQKKAKLSETDPNWRHRPNFTLRKVERPSKEELEKMIWADSLVGVGRHFNVTDNTVRKWANAYEIKLPPRGYYQRRQSGYSHEESLISQARPKKNKRFITDEIVKEALILRQNGLTYKEIGEKLGFGHWSINQAIERYQSKMAARAGDDPASSDANPTSLV